MLTEEAEVDPICWECKYFHYTSAWPGHSDETPGNDFSLECRKRRWTFDAYETTQREFVELLKTAHHCADFEEEPDGQDV